MAGLPPPASDDAGFEPIEIPWQALQASLVATASIGRGTRQTFNPLEARDWGLRPVFPFAFRREAEPLARPGYWHPIPRLSLLVVPYRPLGQTAGPNAAVYALADGGVRFARSFEEHGLQCAAGPGLAEDLAIETGGAEIRRVYGCPGIGEEATVESIRLEETRLVIAKTLASFLVHRP